MKCSCCGCSVPHFRHWPFFNEAGEGQNGRASFLETNRGTSLRLFLQELLEPGGRPDSQTLFFVGRQFHNHPLSQIGSISADRASRWLKCIKMH